MLFECPDCHGKISRYYAELRVCQDCKRIINLDDLLKLLRNLGATERTVRRVHDDLAYPKLFAA
ncbi:MAG: hypothetical protein PVH73_02750 [Candidatus Bathyarchaeota archaeon]|jgi:hypothetical protein